MSAVKERALSLSAGDTLTWQEFERRWDATPEVKFAELIGGKVYMPSPLSVWHGEEVSVAIYWVAHYAAHTPGCKALANPTCRMLGDAPQPDVCLRIEENCGGHSRVQDNFLHGAPELVVEVCLSSAAYDLHEKKDLYEQAGVGELVALLLHEQEVRWYRLEAGRYALLKPTTKGVFHSVVFPGLWLNVPALLKGDVLALRATLERGLATPEHGEFVRRLEKSKTSA